MQNVPAEILIHIFQQLPIYSQRQCSCVCRQWRPAALSIIDKLKTVALKRDADALQLERRIKEDPRHAERIYRLLIDIPKDRFRQSLSAQTLINIYNGCPNLGELVLPWGHSWNLYITANVPYIPFLESIQGYCGSNSVYLEFAFRHRNQLNRLNIGIGPTGFVPALVVDTISPFFVQFSSLKCLTLNTSCYLVLGRLLTACPQLQVLKLLAVKLNKFKVQDTSSVDSNIKLEKLSIEGDLYTQEMHDFLESHCKYLSQLTLSEAWKNPVTIIDVFGTGDSTTRCLTFKGGCMISNILLGNLTNWFSRLQQVELHGCNLSQVVDGNSNILLDFGDMHLHYLSLDLSSVFGVYTFVAKIALEIVSDTTTHYYQRDGKGTTDRPFTARDNPKYFTIQSRAERFRSNTTAIFTIQSRIIHCVRFRFFRHKSNLDQLIAHDN